MREEAIDEMLLDGCINIWGGTADNSGGIRISGPIVSTEQCQKPWFCETPEIKINGKSPLTMFRHANEVARKCESMLSGIEEFSRKTEKLETIILDLDEINYLMSDS